MVRVNRVKGGKRALTTITGRAAFSILMECTPEIGHCHSVSTHLFHFETSPHLLKGMGMEWGPVDIEKDLLTCLFYIPKQFFHLILLILRSILVSPSGTTKTYINLTIQKIEGGSPAKFV
jgi:hypothetical protein